MTSSEASATISAESSAESAGVSGIFFRHLTALVFPLGTLLFLWTGPHPWYIAPLFLVPTGATFFFDQRIGEVELRQPQENLPAWPFDALVYLLAALQFWIIYELARMFSSQVFFSIDMLMVFVIVGGSSGFSIITAHELIHRRKRWEQALGRGLLCTVLYEHFYTEHIRGHHVRVGTEKDPATARFGETFPHFYRRTLPAQFKSAWRLEAKRLGDQEMGLFDRRILRSRVVHGLALGWGLATLIGVAFGPVALLAHLLQAFVAVRLLEIVNYFEHWGLMRREKRIRPEDSWDTHTRFTYYGLVGLSRHADHHAYPSRPYQQLRVFDEAPVLPVGYVALIDMVMANNKGFQEIATQALEERKLGPFTDVSGEAEIARLRDEGVRAADAPRFPRLAPYWQKLPAWGRPVVFWSLVLLAISLGAQLEAGEAVSFMARLAQHVWIFAVFAGLLLLRLPIQNRLQHEGLSWGIFFLLLLSVGRLSESLLA